MAAGGRALSVLVLMGVSGSGKSTLAAALATTLGWPVCEGDDLHPPANVAKMRAGIPLTDADRWPWLERVAAWIDAHRDGGVVTCSALARAYRDVLRRPDVVFVWLDGPRALLEQRLARRVGHYMPAALLDSQLATLEPPGPDEQFVRVDIALPLDEQVRAAAQLVGADSSQDTKPM